LIFLFACLLYVNTIGHDFVLDDAIVITENVYTKAGFSGWKDILSTDTFHGFFQTEGKDKLVSGGRYRPLSLLWFSTIGDIFGHTAWIFHLFNVLFYGLCCLLIYHFFLQFIEKTGSKDFELLALIGACLFTAHATHTEVVANIKGVDEIMAGIGAIASLLFIIRYANSKKISQLLAGMGCLFLSLLAKETALTFLFIAPITAFFISSKRQIILHTFIGAMLVIGIYLFIRFSVLGLPDLGQSPQELLNNPFLKWDGSKYISFSANEKFGTILFTLLKYIQLMLFPHPLVHDYYPRHIDIHTLGEPLIWLATVIYLSLCYFAFRGFMKKSIWSYGILFFLLSLFITSNILLPVGTNMSERFLFLPSVGVCLLLAVFMGSLLSRPKMKNITWVILGLFLLGNSIKTVNRNSAWSNNFSLFTTDVINAPNSAKLRNAAAGTILSSFQAGDTNDKNKLDIAIDHLKKAIDIHPQYKNAYLLLGNAHLFKEDFDSAIAYYLHSLKLDPDYQEARNNLAIAYRSGGRFYGEQKGDLNKAIKYLEQANDMQKGDYETLRLLGVAYGQRGEHMLATKYLKLAVEIMPDFGEAWYNLGIAYYNVGEIQKKDSAMRKAIELDPKIAKRFVK
jgi:Flp pilus assembly protein TadD